MTYQVFEAYAMTDGSIALSPGLLSIRQSRNERFSKPAHRLVKSTTASLPATAFGTSPSKSLYVSL